MFHGFEGNVVPKSWKSMKKTFFRRKISFFSPAAGQINIFTKICPKNKITNTVPNQSEILNAVLQYNCLNLVKPCCCVPMIIASKDNSWLLILWNSKLVLELKLRIIFDGWHVHVLVCLSFYWFTIGLNLSKCVDNKISFLASSKSIFRQHWWHCSKITLSLRCLRIPTQAAAIQDFGRTNTSCALDPQVIFCLCLGNN